MATKTKRIEKLLSQCPVCKAVEVEMPDGKIWRQQTFVVFEKLPAKPCYSHEQKSNPAV